MSVEEIAQVLSIREKTVYSRPYEAFRRLRNQIEGETEGRWTRWMLAILLAWAGGLVLLVTGPWYGYARNEVFAQLNFLVVLAIGLLPAFL